MLLCSFLYIRFIWLNNPLFYVLITTQSLTICLGFLSLFLLIGKNLDDANSELPLSDSSLFTASFLFILPRLTILTFPATKSGISICLCCTVVSVSVSDCVMCRHCSLLFAGLFRWCLFFSLYYYWIHVRLQAPCLSLLLKCSFWNCQVLWSTSFSLETLYSWWQNRMSVGLCMWMLLSLHDFISFVRLLQV